MFRLLLVAFIIAFGSAQGLAQTEEEDPIDQALTKCMDAPEALSTQGMVECFGAEYDSWDKALNQAYGELMKSLDPSEAELLKAAQRDWIKFRDAESDFLASLVTPERGSIMRLTVSEAMSDLVKERVLQLRSLAEE